MIYECGYCGKGYPNKDHEDLEELRAELVKAIYYIENEMLRNQNTPKLFLNDDMLDRYRKRLHNTNKKLQEIEDEI